MPCMIYVLHWVAFVQTNALRDGPGKSVNVCIYLDYLVSAREYEYVAYTQTSPSIEAYHSEWKNSRCDSISITIPPGLNHTLSPAREVNHGTANT